MPSQRCDVEGQSLRMISYRQSKFCLSVYARKESAIYIVYGERVACFSDQCVFFDESRVYKISHGP
jgi:hypothetical protein